MSKLRDYSPLRYPGGKSCLTNFISELAELNGCSGGTYVELYAGGAGAALNLLFNGTFEKIHINDFDFNIYSFWYSVINETEDFIKLIQNTPVTIKEWHSQKELYSKGKNISPLELGFSTFYLNRTNRSGIIYKAGPIGGLSQKGNYLINVRFNKENLIKRIEKIASKKDQILLTNEDAAVILQNIPKFHMETDAVFLYLDPPYYKKGKHLYLNNYSHSDHENLSKKMIDLDPRFKWLISYDNTPEIRKLYSGFRMSNFDLNYTLQSKRFGSELLVFSDGLRISGQINVNSRKTDLVLM